MRAELPCCCKTIAWPICLPKAQTSLRTALITGTAQSTDGNTICLITLSVCRCLPLVSKIDQIDRHLLFEPPRHRREAPIVQRVDGDASLNQPQLDTSSRFFLYLLLACLLDSVRFVLIPTRFDREQEPPASQPKKASLQRKTTLLLAVSSGADRNFGRTNRPTRTASSFKSVTGSTELAHLEILCLKQAHQ